MRMYGIGDRVTHAQYGDGSVASVDIYHTKIDFDAHGSRTFRSQQVVLTAASTFAPIKTARPRRRKVTAPASS
jgi:hypothetical protein